MKLYKMQNPYRKNRDFLFIGFLLWGMLTFFSSFAQTRNVYAAYTQNWATAGPPQGTLMIIGGAASSENYNYFMALVDDPHAKIVFIPTAGSIFDETHAAYQSLVNAGAKNISILHTKDNKEADQEYFAGPLREAKAVFMAGGFQSRLAAAYLNTLTHELMFDVLKRGGVIAGSSAGASIQGSYLYGGLQGGVGAQYVGLGFVKNSAIGQHYIRRNRMGSVAKILKEHPGLFGFGVDEATAAVIRGDEMEVVGEGKVALYDPTRSEYVEQAQQYLYPGDKYDMASRQVRARTDLIPSDLWIGGGAKHWKNPASDWKTSGPPKGKLLLYGSKGIDKEGLAHFFKSLGKGKENIVVLSTGNEDMRVENQQVVVELQKLGAQHVSFLHTINGELANSHSYTQELAKAQAVWICDSRSWQLADTYLYTLIHRQLFQVLTRGGTLGGNGDGAAMMASRLFGEPEKYGWHAGYGFLKNILIAVAPKDSTVRSELVEVLNNDLTLTAIVLGEKSKIRMEKNRITVLDGSPVEIYRKGKEEKVVVLPEECYRL